MARKKTSSVELSEAAHKVWLAGLGALATAGDEGEKLFKTLVNRGEKFEKRVQRPVKKASKSARGTVDQVRERAGKTFGSIQSAIDESVSTALHTIGVPTRSEIADLTKRVQKLTRAVEGRTNGRKRPARKATRKTTASKKVARKRTTSRKAS